ncbi:MAG TPA: redoxin domain-containing protein [Candidatus Krumholzibacteria bacterium]|nr:redoxin domain-containing protein [Candidatus Krumholzibacteria bacterium]
MTRRKRVLLLSSAALVVVAAGVVGGSFVGREFRKPPRPQKPVIDSRLAVGQTMPDATFLATYGDTIRLQDLTAGRKAVLIFLATTCTPCADLAAEWREVFPDYGSTYELIGVSSEPAAVVERFASKWGIQFPIILDSKGRFGREYRIEASPTMLGIDESGLIAFAEIGYEKDGAETIQNLLGRF